MALIERYVKVSPFPVEQDHETTGVYGPYLAEAHQGEALIQEDVLEQFHNRVGLEDPEIYRIRVIEIPLSDKKLYPLTTNTSGLPNLLLFLDEDRPWLARVVFEGDRYGLNNVLIHDKSDPLVEFYDRENLERFSPWGQFVSRYYLSTLTMHKGERGLNLDMGVPSWQINGESFDRIISWAKDLAEMSNIDVDQLRKEELKIWTL